MSPDIKQNDISASQGLCCLCLGRKVADGNPIQDIEYLGLGGKASKNKLKDASFIFSMTNITILSIFRTHAQKEYRKVLEMKGTYILNILALLLFENLQRIY